MQSAFPAIPRDKYRDDDGAQSLTIHAPRVNWVATITPSTTNLATAPKPFIMALANQPSALSLTQWRTISSSESLHKFYQLSMLV